MAPTLRPGIVLLTRRLRRSDGVRRGDVVVLRSAELGRRVVKRVVGLPGETVVVDSRGVSVDRVPLDEPYVLENGGPEGSFSVPDGAYLVLGDNRARSSDSRSWRQPFVARSAVEGRWIRLSRDSLAGFEARHHEPAFRPPEVGTGHAGEGPGPECGDLGIERGADAAHLAPADAGDPQRPHQVVHPARAAARHVRLLDDREQGALGPTPGFEQTGQVAAVADPRDVKRDGADPRVPAALAVPVAVRQDGRGVTGAAFGERIVDA